MATKNYQWTAALTVDSGGYVGETITIESNGVVLYNGAVSRPPQTFNLPWNTTTDESGSATYTYTYRDSDRVNNSRSTKVAITMRDEWTVEIDNRNFMTVNVHTTLISAVRTRIGNITNVNRHIWLKRYSGGPDFAPFPLIDNATNAHTIASNVDMGTYSFTLAPGQNAQRASAWWRSTSVGHESDPIPNIYTDILGVGIHFKNILPPDYRPGKVRNPSNVWLSTNREGGKCHIMTNTGTLKELRTYDGAVGTTNPPYIRHNDNTWRNQRLIGQE